jgi:hypothetical protein
MTRLIFIIVVASERGGDRNTGEGREGDEATKRIKERKTGVKG